jgi:hypothetical protein
LGSNPFDGGKFVITPLLIAVRAVHITASILIAGSFTFNVVSLGVHRRTPGEESLMADHVLVRLITWSLIAAALSGVLWFWLEVVNMSGRPLLGVFSISAGRKFYFIRNSVICGSFASVSASRSHSVFQESLKMKHADVR